MRLMPLLLALLVTGCSSSDSVLEEVTPKLDRIDQRLTAIESQQKETFARLIQQEESTAELSESLSSLEDSVIAYAQTAQAWRENQLAKEDSRRKTERLEAELAATEARIADTKERMRQAEERFASLSPLEQSKVIQIKKKADAYGPASLNRSEAELLLYIGTIEATRQAQEALDLLDEAESKK